MALGHDQLHALSEQGLQVRRDALHEHAGRPQRLEAERKAAE
jgi:hypothetical protein